MASIFEPPQYQRLLNFEVDQHLGCQSELLNQVWGLEGLNPFLSPVYESFCQVWFQRGYRAAGFKHLNP